MDPRIQNIRVYAVLACSWCLVSLSQKTLFGLAQDSGSGPAFRMDTDRGFVRVPFELYQDGIVLKTRINGSRPVLLMLDTGAGQTIINERLFSDLRLTTFAASSVKGGAGQVQGHAAQGTTISLKGLDVHGQLILSAPMDPLAESGRDIEGIIGTTFLQNFVVEIDYAGQVVTFFDPKVRSLSHDANAIPLTVRDNIPCAPAELSFDGKRSFSAQFFVDTGLNRTFNLGKGMATEHQFFSAIPSARRTTGLGESIGGALNYVEARIPMIRIGGQTVHDPIITVPDNSEGLYGESGAGGLLGAGLLKRFTMVLDYRSQKLLLRPNAKFNEPFEIDMSGLELRTELGQPHQFVVQAILPGYPAAKAGIKAGDEIIAVNGTPSEQLDLGQLIERLKKADQTYSMTVRRAGHKAAFKFATRRVI